MKVSIKKIMTRITHRLIILNIKIIPRYISPSILSIKTTINTFVRFSPSLTQQFMGPHILNFAKGKIMTFLFRGVKFSKFRTSTRTKIATILNPLFLFTGKAFLKFVGVFIVAIKITIFHIFSSPTTRQMGSSQFRGFNGFVTFGAFPHTYIISQKGGQ